MSSLFKQISRILPAIVLVMVIVPLSGCTDSETKAVAALPIVIVDAAFAATSDKVVFRVEIPSDTAGKPPEAVYFYIVSTEEDKTPRAANGFPMMREELTNFWRYEWTADKPGNYQYYIEFTNADGVNTKTDPAQFEVRPGDVEGDGDGDDDTDGDTDGSADGDVDGDTDGSADGDVDGDTDGSADGDVDGDTDGDTDGDGDTDLQLINLASGATLQTSEQDTFSFEVTNLGANNATEVVFTLQREYTDNCAGVLFCDGAIEFKEVTSEQGQCTFSLDQLTCHLDTIQPQSTVIISGTVEARTPGTINYSFQVNASEADPDRTNNEFSAQWYVYPDYLNSNCKTYTSQNWAHAKERRAITCEPGLCTTGDAFRFESNFTESTLYMGNDGLSYSTLSNCELGNAGEIGSTAVLILTQKELPNSENVAFTEDGRMFVALANSANSRVVEVTKTKSGYQTATLLTAKGCLFSGLTAKANLIYAACSVGTSNTGKVNLYKINPDDPNRYAPIELEKTVVSYANGMAIDKQGNLLISNSFANAYTGSKPSIVKVELGGDTKFVVQTTPWLTGYTAGFPNGIQVDGDDLYYANASDLYKIEITTSTGSAGTVNKIYSVGSQYWIDDFAVGTDFLAISQIPNPTSNFSTEGAIKILDKTTYTEKKAILPESGFYKPSSVGVSKGTQFGSGHLFVTDYFNGGLYLIARE